MYTQYMDIQIVHKPEGREGWAGQSSKKAYQVALCWLGKLRAASDQNRLQCARARARAHLQRAVTSGIFPEAPILFDSLCSSFSSQPAQQSLCPVGSSRPFPCPRLGRLPLEKLNLIQWVRKHHIQLSAVAVQPVPQSRTDSNISAHP